MSILVACYKAVMLSNGVTLSVSLWQWIGRNKFFHKRSREDASNKNFYFSYMNKENGHLSSGCVYDYRSHFLCN